MKISVDFECLREILSIFDKLSFIFVAEMNSNIIQVCLTVLERISDAKINGSASILTSEGEDEVSESKNCEKELTIIQIIEKLALKIMDQMQNYVYQDINLGDLKKKLLDRTYEGLEGRYLNSTGVDSSSNSKLALLKDTYDLLKTSLTTLLKFKAFTKNREHLNKISDNISEAIKGSFEFTIHRTALKMPLSVKSYINHLSLIDEVFDIHPESLTEKMNNFIIRLIRTIKVCNSLGGSTEFGKESSEEDSENNSEKRNELGKGEILDSKTIEKLKTTIPYLIQLLNKTVVNVVTHLNLEKMKDSFSFYMVSLFEIQKNYENSREIVNFSYIALKGLNGLFATALREKESMTKIMNFSIYCYEESLVYLFTNIQKIFETPSILETKNQGLTLAISENIRFITNIYLNFTIVQKEIIIDTIIKMFLGILVGIQEKQIQRNKPILNIINTVGDSLYNMIVNGDVNLAKNYIANSLAEQQKNMLQNVIKAIALTKKNQAQQKLKGQVSEGSKVGGNQKFRENQSKIKLATKIGK